MIARKPDARTGDTRGFWALVATQFQGAFNDNLYRFIIVFYFTGVYSVSGEGVADEALTLKLTAMATILFSIPYLLFPGLAGALSDRYSKRTVAMATKVWELGVMTFALAAFWIGNQYLIFFLLYLMFMQSAFFSPAKYGILPEILPESRLSWANGILGVSTFGAIILGQVCAGVSSDFLEKHYASVSDNVYPVSVLLILLSLLGLITSLCITRVPAANPAQKIPINPWSGMGRYFKVFWGDRLLWLVFLGGVYFWLAGAIVQTNVVSHGLSVMALSKTGTSALSAAIVIGIGLGSLAAGFVSRRRIELGLIPLGLAGMAVAALLLAIPGWSFGATASLLFALGFFAGFYVVPLQATVQHRAPAEIKGGVIAAFNIGTCVGILGGGGLVMLAGYVPAVNTHVIFLIVGLLTVATCVFLCWRHPVFMLRSVLWLMMNTVYRMRTLGRDHIPERGGALLVANHTSFVDALVLTASIDRPIRFLMSTEIHEIWWIKWIADIAGCIPVSSLASPKDLLTAMRAARDALESGDLVCIFAEGQITRSGQMLPFRKGFERITKDLPGIPIIPVHLDQVWGSIFSFAEGKFFWKKPKRLPYPVTINIGAPMPHDTTAFALHQRIRELGTDSYSLRKPVCKLLHRGFMRMAKRHPKRRAIADGTSGSLTYGKAMIASVLFARKLRPLVGDAEMVGVLVPPTAGGVLTNIALQLLGKVPVNLNYTVPKESMQAAADQCGITHVITAKKFLEKLPVHVPGEPIYLEDVKATVTGKDRITSLLMAFLLPVPLLERVLGVRRRRSNQDLATVIFSSGSEGKPKGVPLSHFNVISDIELTLQVFPHNDSDCMMGFLPFFHSFGYTGTLWLPLLGGFSAVYHPSPLEAKQIAQLIHEHKCTLMVAAPTFLQSFVRRCLPEELSSLKFVATGAEKLPARLREAFRDKFGVEPLEGYGTTECAPIVSLNIPDMRGPGYFQVGTRHGTIGKPIPGVSVRVVDPDTGEILPQDTPGMLLVKGPNVMSGYMHLPDKTAEVLHDGWYRTGDIAKIDEDGFITITDRLARFSKIGGEMVPHTHVEEVLHTLAGQDELALAVTGLPDVSKGERLVVLHTLDDEKLQDLLSKLDKTGMPNLWVPRSNAFYRVEAIPVLGTGKLDLRQVRELAKSLDVGGDD
jgi:acyl-[acyl-carrier-protein]-phospholipid O-acyltransferase / long-chain-fatty-acid--[acyl-carrier-protein] ligase